MGKRKKERTFEQAFQRLSEIAESLEAETITLEESIHLYEEGIELAQFCAERLGTVQKRVVELRKRAEGIFDTVEIDLD